MSAPMQRFGALALTGVLLIGAYAEAQRTLYPTSPLLRPQIIPFPVNRNQYIAPNMTARQMAYNTAVLGRGLSQVPPWAYGYNPYPNPIVNYGQIGPAVAPYNPYALSTVPTHNPYLGGTSTLSSDPYGAGGYSLSTTPYGSSGSPYNIGNGYGGLGGWGNIPYAGQGYAMSLQGIASVTAATGQYWMNIEQARLMREQSRQAALDTARKRIQMEAWYESIKPTAQQYRDRELATDLERARKDAPATDVWSGKALNDLLRSIQGSSKLSSGPNITLAEDTLKHINLTDRASGGNVGMLKREVRLVWPRSLEESGYDEVRKRLARNLRSAVDMLKDREPVAAPLLKDIDNDYKDLQKKLNEGADDMSPAQYIEAKRFLNQLGASVKALSDPRTINHFNNTWNARGKNVAELIAHMTKEGLVFAPATQGDEASYSALYQAVRAFENALQSGSR